MEVRTLSTRPVTASIGQGSARSSSCATVLNNLEVGRTSHPLVPVVRLSSVRIAPTHRSSSSLAKHGSYLSWVATARQHLAGGHRAKTLARSVMADRVVSGPQDARLVLIMQSRSSGNRPVDTEHR